MLGVPTEGTLQLVFSVNSVAPDLMTHLQEFCEPRTKDAILQQQLKIFNEVAAGDFQFSFAKMFQDAQRLYFQSEILQALAK